MIIYFSCSQEPIKFDCDCSAHTNHGNPSFSAQRPTPSTSIKPSIVLRPWTALYSVLCTLLSWSVNVLVDGQRTHPVLCSGCKVQARNRDWEPGARSQEPRWPRCHSALSAKTWPANAAWPITIKPTTEEPATRRSCCHFGIFPVKLRLSLGLQLIAL